ncbi:hypothetical protein VMB_00010 [Vibrio mimicus VM603]|uniref:Uncharacterized protein n=1 Tax=Vibrio mimicus VM603 TaxID=671074 RepID=D2Y904_VIBMI|nr:hypothetical protein VMB_00010 [Vibrio mimicus VM603]
MLRCKKAGFGNRIGMNGFITDETIGGFYVRSGLIGLWHRFPRMSCQSCREFNQAVNAPAIT